MPSWQMMLMQDPANLTTIFMTWTHNIIMEIMTMVATFILSIMMMLISNKLTNRMMTQNNLLEILWTILPMLILVYMAMPSLQLLYLLEENTNPIMTIKSIGHQWYWTYEYPDFNKYYESYMMTEEKTNKFRLLDVDNRLILPFGTYIRILTCSTDVIHSWTVPSLGLKMDALPGRINQMTLPPSMMGLFFGQCSEICGMNHSFMPIVTEIVSINMFTNWIKTN